MEIYNPRSTCDTTIFAVESTLKNLTKLNAATTNMQFLLGFDGYVDSLYRMVKNRKNSEEIEYYDAMSEFGQRIIEIAGSSGSIERILKKKLGGGFAPNTARAIANMAPKARISLWGTLGYPSIDDIFKDLPSNISLNTVGNMGLTLAMEFKDGKIMSQDMEGIISLDWDTVLERMGGKDNIIAAIETANAIGNGHWSLMPHMTEYWKHLITDIFPEVSNLSKKIFFVDPADLVRRTNEDIRDMLFTLREMNKIIPVVLSVNDREAIEIARVLAPEGVEMIDKSNLDTFENAGKQINDVIGLSYFVIHEPHFATISGNLNNEKFHHWIAEGYTSAPKYTTGAGDHFNGATLMALLSGMNPRDSIVVGNAATAIFVRTGRSPTFDALKTYISNYFYFIQEDTDMFCFPDEEQENL